MPQQLKVLFVCGESRRRSATAEKIFARDLRISARAVGLGETVPRRIHEEDLRWADLVLVMERKYVGRLKNTYRHLDDLPPIESLDISDEYIFMHPRLVEQLQEGVNGILENLAAEEADGSP